VAVVKKKLERKTQPRPEWLKKDTQEKSSASVNPTGEGANGSKTKAKWGEKRRYMESTVALLVGEEKRLTSGRAGGGTPR